MKIWCFWGFLLHFEGEKPSIFNLDTYREVDISKNAWKNEHYIYMLPINAISFWNSHQRDYIRKLKKHHVKEVDCWIIVSIRFEFRFDNLKCHIHKL
jgi:hypothetical protein